MSGRGGRTALVTSAMIVAGIRLWTQLRGKAQKKPFSEWAIGWGATFFLLSLMSEVAPTAAGSLSLVIAFSDFLVNGVSLTNDISGLVTGAEQGQPVFVAQPFAASPQAPPSNGKVKTS
jgi:hypothetical protein